MQQSNKKSHLLWVLKALVLCSHLGMDWTQNSHLQSASVTKVFIPGDVIFLSFCDGVIKGSMMDYVPHCPSFGTLEFESVD